MDVVLYIQRKRLKTELDSMSEDELKLLEIDAGEIEEYKKEPDLGKDIIHTLKQLGEILIFFVFSASIILIQLAIRKKDFSWSLNLDIVDIVSIFVAFALYALIRSLVMKKFQKSEKNSVSAP